MNIIFKMASLVNMTESGCAHGSINGSLQNQDEQASTSGLQRRSNLARGRGCGVPLPLWLGPPPPPFFFYLALIANYMRVQLF